MAKYVVGPGIIGNNEIRNPTIFEGSLSQVQGEAQSSVDSANEGEVIIVATIVGYAEKTESTSWNSYP